MGKATDTFGRIKFRLPLNLDTLGLKELRDTKAETIHHKTKDVLTIALCLCLNVGLRLMMVQVI